jgi:ERCC4-type nuclease
VTVTKAELIDAAEASQLSSLGIKPKAANTSGLALAGVTGAKFTYDGWSGFNKYLTQVPKGHRAPLCFTYGNPLHIRLTDEGRPFAEELHRAAEARGDCTCGLLPPPGAAAPNAAAAAPRIPRTDDAPRPTSAARGPSSAAPHLPPARTAGGAAPRVSLDDDCIILGSSDDDDMPVAKARPVPPPARSMPPPAAPPARNMPPPAAPPAAAQRASVHRAPASPAEMAPAAKRARTGGSADAGASGGAASAGALGAQKSLPLWRLSALSNDEAHDVRLPPLARDATFGQEYDIVLLVDCREQFAHGPQGGRLAGLEEGMQRLQQRGITAEERSLPIGDALWIARHRRFPAQEYCLDLIVERKRIDDLESSIKDNRYKKQKFFLKRCGLLRPCYLLEGDPQVASATGQTWRTKAVKTAMLTTEVVDGFQVLRTPDAHGTFDLYARLTAAQKDLYIKRSAPAQPGAAAQTCLSFEQFCAAVAAAKAENKTVHALWGRMLTHINGVGGEVAEAVVWEYPTPSSLFDAYTRCPSVGAARDLLAPIKTSAVKSIGTQLSAHIHDFVFQT